MREYAIIDINNLINTWIINPIVHTDLTTSKESMIMIRISLSSNLYGGFLTKAFAYLFSETKKERI